MRIVHAWRAWYIFSRDHDVTKLGPGFLEQKGNLLLVIQSTLRSTLGVYDVLSLRVHPHAIKVILPPFYLWWCSREKKYQALSVFRSGGAWERG